MLLLYRKTRQFRANSGYNIAMSYLAIIGRENWVAYAELETVFGKLTKLVDDAGICE